MSHNIERSISVNDLSVYVLKSQSSGGGGRKQEAAQKERTGYLGAGGVGKARGEIAVRSSVRGLFRHTQKLEHAKMVNTAVEEMRIPTPCAVCPRAPVF